MQILISPAKTLDIDVDTASFDQTEPYFLKEAKQLVKVLKDYTPAQLAELMSLSDKLATLNVARFSAFKTPLRMPVAKQALFVFKGDVYTGLDAKTLTKKQIACAQSHLLILSGLYGVLKPLDLMHPYRLEMGTNLETARGKNLYEFWGDKITKLINEALASEKKPLLVNLASNEYFKSVEAKKIEADIITPVFKDKKSGKYKIISFFAKKARGMMARHLIQSGAKNADHIKTFDEAGYAFNESMSSEFEWVFTRDEVPQA